jgi:flavodoxin I
MRTLLVYDSAYGNTKRLADAIAMTLGEDAKVVHASNVGQPELEDFELLIVGSPTQGGRPTKPVKALLDGIPQRGLAGKMVAAFDTRMPTDDAGLVMRLFLRIVGFAAPRIHAALVAKGGRAAANPAGFIVQGKEGPLRAGEVARAEAWAAGLRQPTAA